jgi:hypothetical protein
MKLQYVHEPKTDLALLDFFLEQAEQVSEFDYGDCMREWNRELIFLRDHLRHPDPPVLEKIEQMQGYIQYTPNWDVQSTKDQILSDARWMREYLTFGTDGY